MSILLSSEIQSQLVPCLDEKVLNQRCPCGKSHLLHYRKEPLVWFNGDIWGMWCAVEELIRKASWELSSAMDRIEALEEKLNNTRAQFAAAKTEVTTKHAMLHGAYKALVNFGEHKDTCKVVQFAEAGRARQAQCTCCFEQEKQYLEIRLDLRKCTK